MRTEERKLTRLWRADSEELEHDKCQPTAKDGPQRVEDEVVNVHRSSPEQCELGRLDEERDRETCKAREAKGMLR